MLVRWNPAAASLQSLPEARAYPTAGNILLHIAPPTLIHHRICADRAAHGIRSRCL
jgi:hypothetical protein